MSAPAAPGPGADPIGAALARSSLIEAIEIDAGAIDHAPALVARHLDAASVLVVADDNTWQAAGERLAGALGDAGIGVETLRFPGAPRLEDRLEHGETTRARIEAGDAVPVAVGSGVVNDLVKYGAFRAGRPYACVATAASMDGYASAGSPLLDRGFKHTIPCAPPRVIVADLDVIRAAPPAMTAWGYGDLAGKVPAGGDWIIADALGVEPLDDVAWPLVQDNLRGWLAEPEALAAGDRGATAGLFAGLVLTGLAMELHGSSRPASGADHQIAHLWEMDGVRDGAEPASHGALVGIGALTVLALQAWLCRRTFDDLDPERVAARRPSFGAVRAEIERTFAPAIAARAVEETRAKHVEGAALAERLARLAERWPALRARLDAQLMPVEALRRALEAVGARTDPDAFGIDRAYLRASIRRAAFIRRRYTVLDLLDELGLLEEAIAETVG